MHGRERLCMGKGEDAVNDLELYMQESDVKF